MKLRLSNDKKIISLAIQDEEKNDMIYLYAWNSRNLKPIVISEGLKNSLIKVDGTMRDLVFVANRKYIMLTMKVQPPQIGKVK